MARSKQNIYDIEAMAWNPKMRRGKKIAFDTICINCMYCSAEPRYISSIASMQYAKLILSSEANHIFWGKRNTTAI